MNNRAPIGIMDSGVGGLSILREVRRHLPHEDIIYFADQGHVPYGPRPTAEIQHFVEQITAYFLKQQAKAVVIACNAASAAALHHMRRVVPDVAFVGMEPAVKPAAQKTKTGVIGVITTKATHQGALFASVIDRFAKDVQVETQVCPRFVTLVEAGDIESDAAYDIAAEYLEPLLAANIDQLVLGCTHFPFLVPLLTRVMGDGVNIIDPSPAVARQLARVIQGNKNPSIKEGHIAYVSSGDADRFHLLAEALLGIPVARDDVQQMHWAGGTLHHTEPI